MKVKTIVNYFALCRDKATISLPARKDEIHHLTFSPAESSFYTAAKARTVSLLENAIALDYTRRGVYLNALSWLNSLRLICNHGVFHSRRNNPDSSGEFPIAAKPWDIITAQRAFQNMICAGAALCVGCASDLTDIMLEESLNCAIPSLKPLLSECLFLLCGSCRLRCAKEPQNSLACPHEPRCRAIEISSTSSTSIVFNSGGPVPLLNLAEMPTKIRALVAGLQDCHEEKR